jgi:hypothetical protein
MTSVVAHPYRLVHDGVAYPPGAIATVPDDVAQHVGPGVLAHTDQHVVQRLMRAVQVGGRDLTDQLAIAS